MNKERILIIGACGQIGVDLTIALRNIYGTNNVIATDLRQIHPSLNDGPCAVLDAMNKDLLHAFIMGQNIRHIYILAAMLSATGEKNPQLAWNVNMQILLNTLDIARQENIAKVFWPSSIAIFGHTAPKLNCPQNTIIKPTTIYGISKCAGELWCDYYHTKFGLDIRSLRYPGIISYMSAPGGGTTDYAIDIFKEATEKNKYECYLAQDTYLPMMYMPDAIRATIELMAAPAEKIKDHRTYNVSAISFSPKELAAEIKKHLPAFDMQYKIDYRQQIAESWPQSIDDKEARNDWGWQYEYTLEKMTTDMLQNFQK